MHSKNKEQSICTHFPGILNIFSERSLLYPQYPSIIVSMVKFPCVNITVKRDKVKLVDYKSIYNDNPACPVLQPDWLIQSRDLSVYFKLLGNGGDDLDRYMCVRAREREKVQLALSFPSLSSIDLSYIALWMSSCGSLLHCYCCH